MKMTLRQLRLLIRESYIDLLEGLPYPDGGAPDMPIDAPGAPNPKEFPDEPDEAEAKSALNLVT